MMRGVSSLTIAASGGIAQAASLAKGASGCVWFGLGEEMGSFGIFWVVAPQWGGRLGGGPGLGEL
jgi:hypothetical protein